MVRTQRGCMSGKCTCARSCCYRICMSRSCACLAVAGNVPSDYLPRTKSNPLWPLLCRPFMPFLPKLSPAIWNYGRAETSTISPPTSLASDDLFLPLLFPCRLLEGSFRDLQACQRVQRVAKARLWLDFAKRYPFAAYTPAITTANSSSPKKANADCTRDTLSRNDRLAVVCCKVTTENTTAGRLSMLIISKIE
mmetsp:Transcript_3094/g.5973  ORF Transcript_3094/g.5973 Transcript_3094/m.5973 type:complete len:194 (+) Transcript_3094:282-863(+)